MFLETGLVVVVGNADAVCIGIVAVVDTGVDGVVVVSVISNVNVHVLAVLYRLNYLKNLNYIYIYIITNNIMYLCL